MIKAVSFDFWFTIISTDQKMDDEVNETRREGLEKLFKHYGIPINSEEIIPKMQQAKKNIIKMKNEQDYIDFSSRDIQIPYILEFMSPEIPVFLTRAKPILKKKLLDSVSEIITEALLSHNPPLIPFIEKTVLYVKDQGFQLGIVSNTGLTKGKSLKKILEHYKILHHFDSTIFSDEVELMKPNPKIFQSLSKDLEIAPSEIIHVGDTIFTDIVGARKAGFHEGILFLGAYDNNYQYRNLENDFEKFNPRYIIDDYQDFPEVLTAIMHGKSNFLKIRNQNTRKRLKLD
jgi:FMN phosphatase YigB (HAD superfamily)